jgi:hypothetical protein
MHHCLPSLRPPVVENFHAASGNQCVVSAAGTITGDCRKFWGQADFFRRRLPRDWPSS